MRDQIDYDIDTFDDPSTVKLTHERPVNPPLIQDWPERSPSPETERRETAQDHKGEVVEGSGMLLRPMRQTPTERKAEALEQAVVLARTGLYALERSLDELSIADAVAAEEESDFVVPAFVAYLERIEQRNGRQHRAATR